MEFKEEEALHYINMTLDLNDRHAANWNRKAIILEAMKKAGEPLNAGKVAELTGLDRKVVDKACAEMKKEGSIVSPVRCKWEPAEK